METHDVIVVGGGPAGSSCAAELVRGGADVLVLDRETFPRLKLCAGWVTPDVLQSLALAPADYPHRFLTFDHLRVDVRGVRFRLGTVQHSIRRYEFDAFLLERSRAPVARHNVREIRRDGGGYVVDDVYRCRYLVGAGGTRCPVHRTFFQAASPRAKGLQIATLEHEFEYQWTDPSCHLWFFDQGLPGYSWYVPKGDGWVNCGVGAMAEKLKASDGDLRSHWNHLLDVLDRAGLVRGVRPQAKGYSYFLRGDVGRVRVDDAFVCGDSVGLATVDLGEGIGPAIRSGQLAARAILDGSEYSLRGVAAYSPVKPWLARGLDRWRRWREDRAVSHAA